MNYNKKIKYIFRKNRTFSKNYNENLRYKSF